MAADLVSFFGKVMQGKAISPASWEQLQRRQPPPREPAPGDDRDCISIAEINALFAQLIIALESLP